MRAGSAATGAATELDFSEDARQWREEFTEFERTGGAVELLPVLLGRGRRRQTISRPTSTRRRCEEQKYFLATQQVDEARHAVFFKRFMHEVCGVGDGSMATACTRSSRSSRPGFRKIFDRLDTMADELRASARRPMLAAAVTLYHIVIEASLAQPGQHFICSYLESRDVLPAFRAGMANVAADEQRHIGFGVKLLADLSREDPVGVPRAVARILREVTRYTAQVLMPPDWDERYITVFGSTYDEVGVEGLNSMTTKLRSAGLAMETLPGPPMLPPGLSALEISERGRALAQAGVIGVREGPTLRDPPRSRCCSTPSAARSTPTTASAAERSSSGSSSTPTCPPGTSPSRTGQALQPRARRHPPTCACACATRTGWTSSASASTRCGRFSAVACGPAATPSGYAGSARSFRGTERESSPGSDRPRADRLSRDGRSPGT